MDFDLVQSDEGDEEGFHRGDRADDAPADADLDSPRSGRIGDVVANPEHLVGVHLRGRLAANGYGQGPKAKQCEKSQFSKLEPTPKAIKPRSYHPNDRLGHVGKAVLSHNAPPLRSENGRSALS